MIAANGKILVRSDLSQKQTYDLAGIQVSAALLFEKNYREKSPVIAQAEHDRGMVLKGDILICHHNTFYSPSPYHTFDDQFSIPCNGNIIFAKLNPHDGSLLPIYGNMLCDRVDIERQFVIPDSKTQYLNVLKVTDPGYTVYKKDQIILTRPYAFYEIVYNWGGDLRRVHKCHDSQVCGFIQNPA